MKRCHNRFYIMYRDASSCKDCQVTRYTLNEQRVISSCYETAQLAEVTNTAHAGLRTADLQSSSSNSNNNNKHCDNFCPYGCPCKQLCLMDTGHPLHPRNQQAAAAAGAPLAATQPSSSSVSINSSAISPRPAPELPLQGGLPGGVPPLSPEALSARSAASTDSDQLRASTATGELATRFRFGANDAAARASAATATATERMKEGMAGSFAAMKRLNLGFKRPSQQEGA